MADKKNLPLKFNPGTMRYEPVIEDLGVEDKKISESEWKTKLSKEAYGVLRKKGTEKPFTGKLLKNKKTGVYVCGGCGKQLFKSATKFDSGTGWPSFNDAIQKNIEFKRGWGLIFPRTEVICKNCKGHLGHVFKDGPKPTGKRYCINSVALNFKKNK